MATALYVTTKVFCKRALIGGLLAVGTLVIGPLLFMVLTRLQGLSLDHMEHDMSGYHFAYLGLSWIGFLGVALHALSGSEKICRALPVSSRAIASWLMFAMVGLVVCLQLLTNGVYRMLFFDERWLAYYWPLLGPLLFMVTLILLGHCFFWSLQAPSFTRVVLALAIFGGLFFWFLTRYYPNGFHADLVPWRHVTLGEFVLMELVSVAAWYQGTRAFAQVRSGTAAPSPAWEQVSLWSSGLLTGSLPAHPPEPLSRRMALAKLHWRDSCYRAVIFSGTLFGSFVLAITLGIGSQMNSPRFNVGEVAEGYSAIMILGSLIAAILVAFLLGDGICPKGRTEMQRYLAMAPLPDRELNARLFRNMLKAAAYTFGIVVGALLLSLLLTSFLWGTGLVNFILNHVWGGHSFLPRVFFTGLAYWIIVANGVALLWTGRTWFINTMVGVGFGGFVSYVIIFNLLGAFFRGQILAAYLIELMLLAVYSLIVGGTGLAYVFACRTRLLSRLQALLAILVWCGLVAILLSMMVYEAQRANTTCRSEVFWIYSATGALALAPFATIPLALSWNRHR